MTLITFMANLKLENSPKEFENSNPAFHWIPVYLGAKWLKKKEIYVLLVCIIWHVMLALHDLITLYNFKNVQKKRWRSVNFSKVAVKVILLHACFFTFFKLYKGYQIAQSVSKILCIFTTCLLLILLAPISQNGRTH